VCSKNLGRFYKFVNARLANKQGVGTFKNRGGQAVTNDTDRANLLNKYFCLVSVPDNGIVPNFSDKSVSSKLDSVVFNRNVVMKAIKKLKSNLSAGPDGYFLVFILKLVNTISESLALIYNAFMSVGQVPDMWRRAIVTPVCKSGAAYDVFNYRPISLICVFCKVMERVIVSEMFDYLQQKSLINKHQHGFLSRRSATTNLLETFDDWSLAINDRAFVITAYIDFSKAFDVVSHNKLLQKLAAYGIAGNLLSWIKNFLCSRSQMTRVGHSYSNVAYLCSGVKKLHWTVVICHLCE